MHSVLSQNLNIMFSFHFGYLLWFLERALFANRIPNAQKIVQAKIFCAKSGLGRPLGSLTQAFGLLLSFGLPKTRTKASKKQPPIILIPFEVLSHTPPDSANFA